MANTREGNLLLTIKVIRESEFPAVGKLYKFMLGRPGVTMDLLRRQLTCEYALAAECLAAMNGMSITHDPLLFHVVSQQAHQYPLIVLVANGSSK